MSGKQATMASSSAQDGEAVGVPDAGLLLHPELLSREFVQLILRERNISTGGCCSRDRETDLYLRHVIPLPQRTLPDSRWGRRMGKLRGRRTAAANSSSNNGRSGRRPPVVFDGRSSHAAPVTAKKPEGAAASTGITDRLKPPPAAVPVSDPVRRLSGKTASPFIHCSSGTDASLKRGANSSVGMKSPEVKKRIQHVTWP